MTNANPLSLPVVVIGAGPTGLAAAVQLMERGLQPLVLEAAESPAAHLDSFRHVKLFSPWRYNIDPAARRLLASFGWAEPPLEELPTAGEMVDYYLAPLAAVPPLARAMRFSHRVVAVSRVGLDKAKTPGRDTAPFVIRVETPH
jgi:cation diffusion facilitator CzcD-associated flavoprotein CzcO